MPTSTNQKTTNQKAEPKGVWGRLRQLPTAIMDYVFTAVDRIFSPSKDDYPATGTQPYDGDPNKEKL